MPGEDPPTRRDRGTTLTGVLPVMDLGDRPRRVDRHLGAPHIGRRHRLRRGPGEHHQRVCDARNVDPLHDAGLIAQVHGGHSLPSRRPGRRYPDQRDDHNARQCREPPRPGSQHENPAP